MGLFNFVQISIDCPVCKNTIPEFQTKEGKDFPFSLVDFTEVNNFYAICPQCQSFIEFYYEPEKERTIEDYKIKIIKKNEF